MPPLNPRPQRWFSFPQLLPRRRNPRPLRASAPLPSAPLLEMLEPRLLLDANPASLHFNPVPPVPLSSNSLNEPLGLAVADFNNDGNLDMAVVDSAANLLKILLNTSSTGYDFQESVALPLSAGSTVVRAGDMNNDNRIDLVVTEESAGAITVFFNLADNTFSPQAIDDVEMVPTFIQLADFNHDDFLDILASDFLTHDVLLFLNQAGSGTELVRIPVGGQPFGLAVGNFNFDDNLDFAVTTTTIEPAAAAVETYIGIGTGSFQLVQSIPQDSTPTLVAIGDVDGNGFGDMVVSFPDENVVRYFQFGTGTTSVFGPGIEISVPGHPMFLDLVDLNSDGALDLLTVSEDLAHLTVRVGNGDGTFAGPATLATGNLPRFALSVVDPHDPLHRRDVFITNGESNSVTILDNASSLAGTRPTVEFSNALFLPLQSSQLELVVTILVHDDVLVDSATFGSNDLVLRNADRTFVQTGTLLGEGSFFFDAQEMSVSFTFAGPGNGWTPADAGVYTLELVDNAFADPAGNSTAAAVLFTQTLDPDGGITPTGIDLIGAFLAFTDTAVPGDTLEFTVLNASATNAQGLLEVNFYASLDDVFDSSTDLLLTASPLSRNVNLRPGSGASFDFELPTDLLPAAYTIFAQINPNQEIVEANTANNVVPLPLDVQWIAGDVDDRNVSVLNVEDEDGTLVSITTPKGTTTRVEVTDEGFDLFITGTNNKSTVTIKTKDSGLANDDGEVIIRNITIGASTAPALAASRISNNVVAAPPGTTALGKLIAKTARLVGTLDAPAGIGAIELGEVDDNALITIGPAADPKAAATLKFNLVRNLTINSLTPIKSFQATQWLDDDQTPDVFTAPWVGAFKTTGNKKAGLAGDMQAGITLAGNPDVKKPTLGKTTIAGSISAAAWQITGAAAGIAAAALAADTTLNITGPLASLAIKGNASGALTALSAKSISITGNLTAANWLFTQPVDPKLPALATLKVTGSITATHLRAAGHINSITAAALLDSLLFAGVNPNISTLPVTLADFANPLASLKSLTIKGITGNAAAPSFVNSFVAAGLLPKISLKLVNTTNPTNQFGLAADTLGSLSRTGAPTLKNPTATTIDSNFEIRVL